jgi:hypothetical protein
MNVFITLIGFAGSDECVTFAIATSFITLQEPAVKATSLPAPDKLNECQASNENCCFP